jgi:tetratricopeptide (TPR) repeat protein
LGDIDLPKGIEKAIESLKCGEIAQFDIQSEYGYGAHGNAAMKIPPNATLRYEMELSKVVSQKDSWDYNTFAEKLQAGIQRKTDGNAYFSAKRFNQAVRKYQRGLDFIDSKYDASEEEKKQAEELEKTLTLNMAQCYINLREWKKAIESCNKVFETDKSNPKAQFRRAVAYSGLDDWTRATADFDRALELTPGDSAVIAEYNKLKQKMRQQDLKEKKMYTNMFKQLSADQD